MSSTAGQAGQQVLHPAVQLAVQPSEVLGARRVPEQLTGQLAQQRRGDRRQAEADVGVRTTQFGVQPVAVAGADPADDPAQQLPGVVDLLVGLLGRTLPAARQLGHPYRPPAAGRHVGGRLRRRLPGGRLARRVVRGPAPLLLRPGGGGAVGGQPDRGQVRRELLLRDA